MAVSGDDDNDIDLGDGSGEETLEGIASYLDGPGSAGTLISAFLVGIPASIFVGLVQIINGVTDFIATPFSEGADALGSLINALFTAPGDLLRDGADTTGTALEVALGETLAGVLAFPITVAVVLGALFLVRAYLDEEETSNILPGTGLDVAILGEDEEAADE